MELHNLKNNTSSILLHPQPTSPNQSTSQDGPLSARHDISILKADDQSPPPPPRRSNLLIVITSLYLATFLVALDTTILGTVLPAITSSFHALDDLAWYGSAYLLALTALQPTFGKLYKMVEDTKVLYLGCVGVFEGIIICATAPSSALFIAGRAVAGCGAAGLMQGSFAVITQTVPLSQRPFFFGLFVSAFGVSIGIGPVVGGTLADKGLWRWCFWLNLPLGALVMLLITLFLKLRTGNQGIVKSPPPTNNNSPRHILIRLDLAGTILLTSSMCTLFTAMQWGSSHHLPWLSPTIVGLFTVSGVLLALFLLLEWRMDDDASVPFRILKQRSIAFGVVYSFLFSMPNFAYGVYIPMFFQAVRGFSAQRSGIEILFLALTQILVVVVTGALVSKFGYYTPFIIVGTALSVVGSGLITLLTPTTPHTAWAVYFLLCGLGTGAAINLPYTAVSTVLREADMIQGNALLQFSFQLGGAISLCLSQTIFLSTLTSALQRTLPELAPRAVIKAGANNLTALTNSPEQLRTLRFAYQDAVRSVFMFLLVVSGLGFLASFGFECKNVREVERERDREQNIVVGNSVGPV
ncbi:permease of the major facilitator superfamily [Clathrospora elynae]|uniref:Permease of the major facilitator superfamily n=1 Tax=Clathrospora elynae TaxID=706981 RepID=A0A6A5S671_9PLEO|nr:permease of the major facilitator superfamily [Clathrospora elynae]